MTDSPLLTKAKSAEDCQPWLLFPGIIPLDDRASISVAASELEKAFGRETRFLAIEEVINNFILFGERCIVVWGVPAEPDARSTPATIVRNPPPDTQPKNIRIVSRGPDCPAATFSFNPGDTTKMSLAQGARVDLIEDGKELSQVELPDQGVGWVPSACLVNPL